MTNITIGFSRPKGGFEPFSWLIRLVTWSPISHAYIKFYSATYDRWLIYQASGMKVNFVGETLFDSIENIYAEYQIPVTEATLTKTVQFAVDKCGMPYGLLQAFGYLWVMLAQAFGKKVHNPFYTTSSYVCSELVSTILNDLIDEKDELDPGTATPIDVLRFLESKGFKSTVNP